MKAWLMLQQALTSFYLWGKRHWNDPWDKLLWRKRIRRNDFSSFLSWAFISNHQPDHFTIFSLSQCHTVITISKQTWEEWKFTFKTFSFPDKNIRDFKSHNWKKKVPYYHSLKNSMCFYSLVLLCSVSGEISWWRWHKHKIIEVIVNSMFGLCLFVTDKPVKWQD